MLPVQWEQARSPVSPSVVPPLPSVYRWDPASRPKLALPLPVGYTDLRPEQTHTHTNKITNLYSKAMQAKSGAKRSHLALQFGIVVSEETCIGVLQLWQFLPEINSFTVQVIRTNKDFWISVSAPWMFEEAQPNSLLISNVIMSYYLCVEPTSPQSQCVSLSSGLVPGPGSAAAACPWPHDAASSAAPGPAPPSAGTSSYCTAYIEAKRTHVSTHALKGKQAKTLGIFTLVCQHTFLPTFGAQSRFSPDCSVSRLVLLIGKLLELSEPHSPFGAAKIQSALTYQANVWLLKHGSTSPSHL